MGCCFGDQKPAEPLLPHPKQEKWVFGGLIRIPLELAGERPELLMKRCFDERLGWHLQIASVGDSLSSCGLKLGMCIDYIGGVRFDAHDALPPTYEQEVDELQHQEYIIIELFERIWKSYKKTVSAMGPDVPMMLVVNIPTTVKYSSDSVILGGYDLESPSPHLNPCRWSQDVEMITAEVYEPPNYDAYMGGMFHHEFVRHTDMQVPWRRQKELCKAFLRFERYGGPGREHGQVMLQRVPRNAACVKAGVVPGAVVASMTIGESSHSWDTQHWEMPEQQWRDHWDSVAQQHASTGNGRLKVTFSVYKGMRYNEWTAPDGAVWLVLDTPQHFGQEVFEDEGRHPMIKEEQDVKYFDGLVAKYKVPFLFPRELPQALVEYKGLEKMKEVQTCNWNPSNEPSAPPLPGGLGVIYLARPDPVLHRAKHKVVSAADEEFLRRQEEKLFDESIEAMKFYEANGCPPEDSFERLQPFLSFVRPPAKGAHFSLVREVPMTDDKGVVTTFYVCKPTPLYLEFQRDMMELLETLTKPWEVEDHDSPAALKASIAFARANHTAGCTFVKRDDELLFGKRLEKRLALGEEKYASWRAEEDLADGTIMLADLPHAADGEFIKVLREVPMKTKEGKDHTLYFIEGDRDFHSKLFEAIRVGLGYDDDES
eukprot:Hpha_TRINITY_DN9630_c0_g1::TRINITY_DN9630_c0_g1_i1::g.184461::m.184461